MEEQDEEQQLALKVVRLTHSACMTLCIVAGVAAELRNGLGRSRKRSSSWRFASWGASWPRCTRSCRCTSRSSTSSGGLLADCVVEHVRGNECTGPSSDA